MVDFIDEVQREGSSSSSRYRAAWKCGFYKQGQLSVSRENGIQHFQKLVFSARTETA